MELVTLSQPELDRLAALQRYLDSRLTQTEAARQLGISERQFRRLMRRLEAEGPAGVGSRRRGRPGNNRLPSATIARALELVRERYHDFGPTFAAEKLLEVHGIRLSHETLRKAMIAADLWQSRRRPQRQVHPPRERRPCRGELLQLDGSHHRWFEERGSKCVLMVAVDDATSALFAAWFAVSESTDAYFSLLRSLIEEHGRPIAVYTDRHTALTSTGRSSNNTQVGRALRELDIELICANTPQAKGRVERAHQTLQRRLLRELRLRQISDIDKANNYLPEFIADYNRRFAVTPRCASDASRSCMAFDLDFILTKRLTRTLSKNLTFQIDGELYQIVQTVLPARLRYVAVDIDYAAGMRVWRRGERLCVNHLGPTREARTVAAKDLEIRYNHQQPNPKKAHTPTSTHPWRCYPDRGNAPTQPPPDTSTLRAPDTSALR
jgi:transposase-like protein